MEEIHMHKRVNRYLKRIKLIINYYKYLYEKMDKICTSFPQKLWKTIPIKMTVNVCIIMVSIAILCSCTYFKGKAKQGHPALENAMISMTEGDVKKRLGEPDIVSKTAENHIIWTYRPSWKVMPDNKDTIYVEFVDGKVIKVVKGR